MSDSTKYSLFIVFAIACLAMGGIFVRLSEVGPVATGAYRVILALPILLFINRFSTTSVKIKLFHRDYWLLQIAGLCLGLDLIFWNISFFYTSVAESNLIANFVPFFTIPLAYFFFKERVNFIFVVGLIISIAGACLLTFNKGTHAHIYHSHAYHVFGNSLALMAAVFYALFLVTVKLVRGKYSAVQIMMHSTPGCVLVLVLGSLLLHEHLWPHSLYGVLILVGIALSSQIFGQTVMAYSVGHVSMAIASVIMLMQPVISGIYAYFIFHEMLSIYQIGYMFIVLIGAFLARNSIVFEK